MPPTDDGFIGLRELPDDDPAPDRVEVTLRAIETTLELVSGHPHRHQTYDGSIPGPLIRARRGDVLRVNFENHLSEPTTIHWHGLRVPNGMDGVPGITQELVASGGTFVYEFPLLDEGTFWYHPHYDTLSQLGNGLYGAVLVDDPDEEAQLGAQRVLAVSDVSLNADGTPQHHEENDDTRAFGREGATLLVNGRTDQRMQLVSGTRLRLRVMNMARSRYLSLELAGHTFLRIGTDGGRLEYPVQESTPLLTPGDRADLIVEPRGEPGTHIELVTLPVDRGPGASTATGPERLVRLEFIEGPAPELLPLGPLTRERDAFDFEDAEEVQVSLTMDALEHGLVMGINGVPFTQSAPVHAETGRPQIWNVQNETAYAHPFHIHGFSFQVLDGDRLRSPLAYEDTIDIPARETLRLVPRFDEDRLGLWMFHCHILDHAESGMMGVLALTEPGAPVPVLDLSDHDHQGEQGHHGTPSDAGGPPSAPDEPDVPPATSGRSPHEILLEVLTQESYREPPWLAETPSPRGPVGVVTPHGWVRVFANDTLQQSLLAGNGTKRADDGSLEFDSKAPAHDPGSIAVKEFYDGDERVGRAALLKLDGPTTAAYYYCEGPPERCGVQTPTPAYGEMFAVSCGTCHAGFVYTVNYPAQ